MSMTMAALVKARADMGMRIARQGHTRAALVRASGVSESTFDHLVNPSGFSGRTGHTRPATAWRIARAWAAMTDQTEEAAFHYLFEEESTDTTE